MINADVKALGLLRHLLVHQNGRVDQKHLDQCAANPVVTLFSSFALDTNVLLDGEMLRTLVDPVTRRAFELIRLIDKWLTDNKS